MSRGAEKQNYSRNYSITKTEYYEASGTIISSYKEKLFHLRKTYDAKYKSSVRVVKKHA